MQTPGDCISETILTFTVQIRGAKSLVSDCRVYPMSQLHQDLLEQNLFFSKIHSLTFIYWHLSKLKITAHKLNSKSCLFFTSEIIQRTLKMFRFGWDIQQDDE